MSLIVQKYGGTSVGSVDRIQNVAAKIKEQWSQGHKLVVVVSARSGVTNKKPSP
jgi:aspartate kinase